MARKSKAEELLEKLVNKIREVENDSAFKAVWINFARQGLVYQGSNWIDELQAAEEFLNASKSKDTQQLV